MYSYSSRKPDGPDTSESSNRPTRDDSNLPGPQIVASQPVPPFLSRMRKQFGEDASMQTQEPSLNRTAIMVNHSMAAVRDPVPMIYSESDDIREPANKPQYYDWRPAAPISFDEVKDKKATHQQPGTSGHEIGSTSSISALRQRAGEAGAIHQPQGFPQKVQSGREDVNVPSGHPGRPFVTLRGSALSTLNVPPSNYKLVPGPAPYAPAADAVPRRMPTTEAAILEKIKDYYCEQGEKLHARVTESLGQHHGELVERLRHISLVDQKFLHRLDSLDANLRQPFAETRTYKEGCEDSSITISEAVERLRRETVELEKFLEAKWKQWDTAKAAEDEVFARLIKRLENPDPEGLFNNEVKRIKKEAKKLEEKVLEELDELESDFEVGKAELDQEISKRFWG